MTAQTKSPQLLAERVKGYYAFSGVDRSRPRIAMDDGKGQAFYSLQNGYCDFRGVLRRDPAVRRRANSTTNCVEQVRWFNRDFACYLERDAGSQHLVSERGHRKNNVYPLGIVPNFCTFNGKVHSLAGGFQIQSYDGAGWRASPSTLQPSFGVPAQRRLFVAGIPNKPTEIHACRIDDEGVFPDDEEISSVSPDKAAFIDVTNMIGTADEIVGLGSFELNRLAIFTNDQTLVYFVDPDFTKWAIDQRANINIGCISHRATAKVGSDLLFCSRWGVHALTRSDMNGLTVNSTTLSHKIEDLYDECVRSVDDLRLVSAVYDQDAGKFHVFFPQPDGVTSRRLTANVRQGYDSLTWSEGVAVQERCGDFLAGGCLLGTPGGLYETLARNAPLRPNSSPADPFTRGELVADFPIMWHGTNELPKTSHSLMVQASGNGKLIIEAYDDEGIELDILEVQIEARDDNSGEFPDVPLERDYELPFMHTYRGLQLRLRSGDDGEIRVNGIGVDVRVEPRKKAR